MSEDVAHFLEGNPSNITITERSNTKSKNQLVNRNKEIARILTLSQFFFCISDVQLHVSQSAPWARKKMNIGNIDKYRISSN